MYNKANVKRDFKIEMVKVFQNQKKEKKLIRPRAELFFFQRLNFLMQEKNYILLNTCIKVLVQTFYINYKMNRNEHENIKSI